MPDEKDDLISSEELEKQYNEILYSLKSEDAEKFQDFVHGLQHNLKLLSDWAEIDVDSWGNPYV